MVTDKKQEILFQNDYIEIRSEPIEKAKSSCYRFISADGALRLDYIMVPELVSEKNDHSYHITLTISKEIIDKYGPFDSDGCEKCPCTALQIQFYEILHCDLTGASRTLFMEGSILFILHLLKRDSGFCSICKQGETDAQCLKVKQAQEHILENLHERLTIASIALSVGTNQNYLKKNFKEIMGCTVFEFIRENRMLKARFLLQNTNKKIEEIALETGYSSISSFSQSFKDFFGFNPSTISKEAK